MNRSTSTCILAIQLLAFVATGSVYAAVSDCPGFPSDGVDNGTETRCVKPVQQPVQITACPVVGTWLSWANASAACSAEMGLTTGYFSDDGAAIAFTNCVNNKISSLSGNVSGPIPWLPMGSYRSSYLCGDVQVSSENGVEVVGASDNLPTYAANWVYGRRAPLACESDQFTKVVKGPAAALESTCKPRCPKGYRSLIYGGYYQCYREITKIEGVTPQMCPATP